MLSDSDQPTGHPLIRKAEESGLRGIELVRLSAELGNFLMENDSNQAPKVLQQIVAEYKTGPYVNPYSRLDQSSKAMLFKAVSILICSK